MHLKLSLIEFFRGNHKQIEDSINSICPMQTKKQNSAQSSANAERRSSLKLLNALARLVCTYLADPTPCVAVTISGDDTISGGREDVIHALQCFIRQLLQD